MVSSHSATGDVRAVVENLLGTYARLCDERDVAGLAALLTDAVVSFGDADPVTGSDGVTDLFEGAFSAGHRTRHLITNAVITQAAPRRATSRVNYTRWVLDPAPTLVGMGEYHSEFVADEGQWRFLTHTVVRDWFREEPT